MNARVTLDPRTAALLVIDMQNAFCHSEGTLAQDGADVTAMTDIIPRVADLVEGCRSLGIRDFWSVQQHLPPDQVRTVRRIPFHTDKRFRPPALRGSWDAQLVAALQPLILPETYVLPKHRFSFFFHTTLEPLLRMHGVDTVLLAGVATTTCVESTARDAYMRDLNVIVVSDCVASFSAELHTASLRAIDRYFGTTMTASSTLDALRGAAPAPDGHR